MPTQVDDRRPFLAVFASLIVLAWLALWLWGQSPSGRFLRHDPAPPGVTGQSPAHLHGEAGARHALPDHQPAASSRSEAGWPVAVVGWTLMSMAMMLPTSLPLLVLFHAVARRRPDRPLLVGLLSAGYLAVWAAFGLVAHAAVARLHGIVADQAWLAERAFLIGAATVLVAGVYQFTPLKFACLDRCRSPLGFVTEHWRGRRERLAAFRLGVHHGLFCVGCCWSLMLLMLAVGAGSLGWMLALGAVMAAEKNLPWGRRLTTPLGLALLAGSGAIILQGTLAGR